jgi:hypothetical protein
VLSYQKNPTSSKNEIMELYQLVQKEYQGRTDHSNKLLYREDAKKVVLQIWTWERVSNGISILGSVFFLNKRKGLY